jgi:excisionase family DNA binding protein
MSRESRKRTEGESTQQTAKDCDEPILLRVDEVAGMLGLGRSKVYDMTNVGELPVVKLGSPVRVPKQELRKWIERHTANVAWKEGVDAQTRSV